MHVNMLEAKTQLSKLVEAVLRGEEVVIANRGKPVVKLVPVHQAPPQRQLGGLAGLWTEAEIDAAFSAQADAEAAADLWGNLQRRELRVMQPQGAYTVPPATLKTAAKTATETAALKKTGTRAGRSKRSGTGLP